MAEALQVLHGTLIYTGLGFNSSVPKSDCMQLL